MDDDTQQTEERLKNLISSTSRVPNSWANPRKRPWSHDPTAQLQTTLDEDIQGQTSKTGNPQSPKRTRAGEWPLKTSNRASRSDNFSRGAHRKSTSPWQKQKKNSSSRPSKFVEGSMNDKVSQRPPSLYIREEESMEQYTSANMKDIDMVYDAGIESDKPSGMFRFGKAIASAFTSANVWQGLNGILREREKDNQTKPDKDILKVKAELKYAELKKSGYKGTQNAPARLESHEIPAIEYEDTDDFRRNSFRDSGVDVDEYQSSSDRKDSDHFMRSANENLMPPPPPTAGIRSASPFSDASSGNRSSIRFHKPSLEGLKRVSSQLHLPSIKRHAEEPLSVLSSMNNNVPGPDLRRAASKKDMTKQYKLSKKVSDLENKLDTARRELELSLQDAPPVPDLPVHVGRRRYMPGSLPSLPSERLLTPQTQQIEGRVIRGNAKAASAVSVSNANTSTDDEGSKNKRYNTGTQDESAEAARQALWDQRASDIAAHNAAARQSKKRRTDDKVDDVYESEAVKGSLSNMKGARPRKPQDIKVPGRHTSSEASNRPRKVSATPYNSPMTKKNEVPPVPVRRTSIVFDPMKVDKAKIMAMRAISDSRAPFGKAWDDLKNLQKQYPDTAETELKAYLSSQSVSNKITDHTSVAHGDRPSSPFLSRPRSTSPLKTRAQTYRRGISPPPPSVSSAKKFHRNLDAEKSPTAAKYQQTAPRGKDDEKENEEEEAEDFFDANAPLKIPGYSSEAALASLEKPLPDAKVDDFEWDDDVF